MKKTEDKQSAATEGAGFSPEEKAAMKERIEELKQEARQKKGGKVDGEAEVLAKIAAMTGPDRAMGERLHAIIRSAAPELVPRTWYGMPAYSKDGKVLCFFRGSHTFKERYLTLGFNQEARLDEGTMWPIAFAITDLTPAEEERVSALVRRAVGG